VQGVTKAQVMANGLPYGWKTGLVILIQYWLWRTERQADGHVAVAMTLLTTSHM